MTVELPHPVKTWHQYGEIIGHWDKAQMIAYGQACANEARAESILLAALNEIADGTYDSWTEGYRAQQIAIAAIAKALG